MLIIAQSISLLRSRRHVLYVSRHDYHFINKNDYVLRFSTMFNYGMTFYVHSVYAPNYTQLLYLRNEYLGLCAMRHLVPIELHSDMMLYIEDEEYIMRARHKK
jgi:hypothetical protein